MIPFLLSLLCPVQSLFGSSLKLLCHFQGLSEVNFIHLLGTLTLSILNKPIRELWQRAEMDSNVLSQQLLLWRTANM